MVHLCVSISDEGPRLESVLKGSQRQPRDGKRTAVDTTTSRNQPSRTKMASSRQDRGSCSSTASCPVFAGSYSDQEDDAHRSSSLRKTTPCALNHSTPTSLNGSLASLQGPEAPLRGARGAPPGRKGSLTGLHNSIAKLKGSILGLKRRSLGSLDNSASLSSSNEGSSSSSLQSGSSSEDDGSWDTNSWSSGVTCLLRHPAAQQQSGEVPQVHAGSTGNGNADQMSDSERESELEGIYQNLTSVSRPAVEPEGARPSQSASFLLKKKTKSMFSSNNNSTPSVSPTTVNLSRDQRAENRLKFSQFLNEVTCRVLKSKEGHPQPGSTLRHWYPSPSQPPPPSTPPPLLPPSPPPAATATTARATKPLPPPGMWRSPTAADLKMIHEEDSRDLAGSIHHWSKSLPSCRVLEPADVPRKVKGESYSYPERDLALCTKIQTQPSTGRLYLETDIDRVRRLDELAANGALGTERQERVTAKRGDGEEKERETRRETLREKSGRKADNTNKGKEIGEKRREIHSERDRRKESGTDKVTERPWQREKGAPGERERGREKQKKAMRDSHDPAPSPRTGSNGRRSPGPDLRWPEGFPNMSYRSTSLPRSAVNTIYIGKTALKSQRNGCKHQKRSSVHDHKEDLRKRLSFTTHKLEMVEMEFDSTRQYLETELRRAQEELDKFTDKLRRIQSSYAALQRINQDLEDKMHRTTQHHDEEKRALSREIIVLNNHLMEAKITVDKLREDNDLYRKDCNLAAQLLQCSKSHHRAHKMSELPLDFQERISSHLEKLSRSGGGAAAGMCHSPYSDSVSTSVIAKILEKPEPGSGSPVTRSPSPQIQDGDFLSGTGSTDQLNRRVAAYKTSDLYCSDTALYCPERWQDAPERRQSVDLNGARLLQLHAQNSVDSNADEEAFHSGSFSHREATSPFGPHDEFGTGSLPASSSYSSFSVASDDKGAIAGGGVGAGGGGGGGGGGCGRTASSTLSSSHQVLYMDWRDGGSGDYERVKGVSSYDKDSTSFHKSQSIQHMAPSRSPQRGISPAYTRTASCFSEPYHSSSPRLTSSHSMGSALALAHARGGSGGGGGGGGGGSGGRGGGVERMADVHVSEDELSSRWRQLSVEDMNMNTYSSSYHNLAGGGRASPYSFSERHFAAGPSVKSKAGPLYSSFQGGDDVFHSLVLDQCFAAAAATAGAGSSPSPGRSPAAVPKRPRSEHRKLEKGAALYRAKEDSQDSECSLFLSGSSKEKENSGRAAAAAGGKKHRDYVNLSADSSPESLRLSSLEASSLQHFPCPRPSSRPRPSSSSALSVGPALPKKTSPRYQKFGSTGLTRKDSLTKAQLYGTLLN
ncbi:Brain-enriched guanylate kinase-associated protein [Merluccius polli]|uniref:Brain-enriched guanylate kinase-associated protein n=1 Tax=Merluccius polli TaxID=89951 RepID=A0AA47N876_MERPO|nr:Brain-enriched guanylate kinase-associated protein [Merluccius polli]